MADHSHDIERYLSGKMTPAEMHALEKKALSDPFLSDALEGASLGKEADFLADVSTLRQKLAARKTKTSWFSPLRIAASVMVVVAGAYLIYWSSASPEKQTPLAEVQKKLLAPPLTSKEKDSLPLDVAQAKEQEQNLMAVNQPKLAAAKPADKKAEQLRAGHPAIVNNDFARPAAETESSAAAAPSAEAPIEGPETVAKAVPPTDAAGVSGDAFRLSVADTQRTIALQEEVFERKEVTSPSGYRSKASAGRSSKKMLLPKAEKIPVPADEAQDHFSTIRGRVTTTDERKPLAGISVKSKGGSASTHTDAQGNYTISSNTPVTSLVFSTEGVETSEVDAVGGSNVDVQLSAPGKAGEIIVSGGDASFDYDHSDSNIQFASPMTGSRPYNKYLLSALVYPAEALAKKITGNVQVEFTVRRDSTVADFKIERAIGSGCEEELIRLIQAGPKWVPLKQGGAIYDSKVRVRMKFTLPK